jgi:predicted PurR-regulated permease PerM
MDQINHSLPPPHPEEVHTASRRDRQIRNLLVGIFLILLVGFLYYAADFLLPVVLAFLFALVLGPLVRWLRHHGVPGAISALGLVVVLFAAFTSSAYLLSGPVAALIAEAPRIQAQVQSKFVVLEKPLQALSAASAQLQKLTASADNTAERVVVEEANQLSAIASGASHTFAQIGLCLVLLLFILASGDLFSEKLIKVLPTLSDKKKALRIAREIEHEVSRYLSTITIINFGLGAIVGLVFWLIGMPSPVLWGVAAAFLNFIPYIGATIGIIISTSIALIAFDTLGHALLVPAAYLVIGTLEGQVVTPTIVGRRLEMNNVAILIAIAFWAWLWGIVGALIAVPILVTAKVFADHIDGLGAIGEFLGAKSPPLAVQHQEAVAEAAEPKPTT